MTTCSVDDSTYSSARSLIVGNLYTQPSVDRALGRAKSLITNRKWNLIAAEIVEIASACRTEIKEASPRAILNAVTDALDLL
jgi:hypothetical protein